jgi:hypothetical protein
LCQEDIRSQVDFPAIVICPVKIQVCTGQRRFGKELDQALRLSGSSPQALKLFRCHNYNRVFALSGNPLRSFGTRLSEKFTETRLGGLELPSFCAPGCGWSLLLLFHTLTSLTSYYSRKRNCERLISTAALSGPPEIRRCYLRRFLCRRPCPEPAYSGASDCKAQNRSVQPSSRADQPVPL